MAPRWRVKVYVAFGIHTTHACGEKSARKCFADCHYGPNHITVLETRRDGKWVEVERKGLRIAK